VPPTCCKLKNSDAVMKDNAPPELDNLACDTTTPGTLEYTNKVSWNK
jgi:hypothetical protein